MGKEFWGAGADAVRPYIDVGWTLDADNLGAFDIPVPMMGLMEPEFTLRENFTHVRGSAEAFIDNDLFETFIDQAQDQVDTDEHGDAAPAEYAVNETGRPRAVFLFAGDDTGYVYDLLPAKPWVAAGVDAGYRERGGTISRSRVGQEVDDFFDKPSSNTPVDEDIDIMLERVLIPDTPYEDNSFAPDGIEPGSQTVVMLTEQEASALNIPIRHRSEVISEDDRAYGDFGGYTAVRKTGMASPYAEVLLDVEENADGYTITIDASSLDYGVENDVLEVWEVDGELIYSQKLPPNTVIENIESTPNNGLTTFSLPKRYVGEPADTVALDQFHTTNWNRFTRRESSAGHVEYEKNGNGTTEQAFAAAKQYQAPDTYLN